MKIGFFHVDNGTEAAAQGYLWAKAMIHSARNVMPLVPIVHFTDLKSAAVKGVDAVRRKPSEPMGLLRIRHNAGVDGDWLFVDTDVLFQQKVTQVFKKAEFDIAVTSRNWSHLHAASGFSQRMPFNTGVVFSRCPHFWSDVYTRMRLLDADKQNWMGEQETICAVAQEAIETKRYAIKLLNGARYNFPPVVPGAKPTSEELEAAAAIVHYKGPDRKAMLLAKIKGKKLRACA